MGKGSSFAGDQNTNIPEKGRRVSADPTLSAEGVVPGPAEAQGSAEEASTIGGSVQQHMFSDPSGGRRSRYARSEDGVDIADDHSSYPNRELGPGR